MQIFLLSGCGMGIWTSAKLDDSDPRLWDIEHHPPVIPAGMESLISQENQYYAIKGRSISELNREMKSQTPCLSHASYEDNQEKSVACTRALFTLALTEKPPEQTDGLCLKEHFHLKLEIKLTLPQWGNRSDADPAVGEAWDFFLQALTRHEMGHVYIDIKELLTFEQEMESRFTAIPADDCPGKQSAFAKLWEETVEKAKARNLEYDQRTAHGINNGTSFY